MICGFSSAISFYFFGLYMYHHLKYNSVYQFRLRSAPTPNIINSQVKIFAHTEREYQLPIFLFVEHSGKPRKGVDNITFVNLLYHKHRTWAILVTSPIYNLACQVKLRPISGQHLHRETRSAVNFTIYRT